MNFLKTFFVFILLSGGTVLFSQEQEKKDASVYLEFQRFFQNEIKYQGVKGNWIFGLNEITGIHKFDYNNDGMLDVMMEFNAQPIDQGNYTNYYTVLFRNVSNSEYEYVNYIESIDFHFIEYFNEEFLFQKNNSSEKVKYNLKDEKFIKLK